MPVERVVYREIPMEGYVERAKYEALERVCVYVCVCVCAFVRACVRSYVQVVCVRVR